MNKNEDSMSNKLGFGYTPISKVKAKRARWLIKEILPKGILVFISAPAKAGKTTLALHLAICLTTGRPFLGEYSIRRSRRVKVLYISLEDHMGETKVKVKNMLNGRRFPKYFLLLNANSINLPDDFGKINADIENSKADVVVFDTLRRSHTSDENSSSDMSPILNGLRKIVRERKITVIIIHHTGHEVKHKENSGDWLRGTSDYNAVWETLIGLEKFSGSVKTRVFHKYRSGLEFSYKVIKGDKVDDSTGDYPVVDLAYLDADRELHIRDENTLIDILKVSSASANELEEKLKSKHFSRPRIDKALKRLEMQGKVSKEGNSRNTKWYLTESLRLK
jgi:hypothetical protein